MKIEHYNKFTIKFQKRRFTSGKTEVLATAYLDNAYKYDDSTMRSAWGLTKGEAFEKVKIIIDKYYNPERIIYSKTKLYGIPRTGIAPGQFYTGR